MLQNFSEFSVIFFLIIAFSLYEDSFSCSSISDLQNQLHEKDMKLTDIRLEALSSAAQLEQFKDTITKMKVEKCLLFGWIFVMSICKFTYSMGRELMGFLNLICFFNSFNTFCYMHIVLLKRILILGDKMEILKHSLQNY